MNLPEIKHKIATLVLAGEILYAQKGTARFSIHRHPITRQSVVKVSSTSKTQANAETVFRTLDAAVDAFVLFVGPLAATAAIKRVEQLIAQLEKGKEGV